MKDKKHKAIVSRVESKDYYVYTIPDHYVIRCSLRGKFKKEFNLKKDKLYQTDVAVVGDNVEIEINADGSGVITKVNPRKNYLSRKAIKTRGASYRGERLEQIIASNLDKVFIISSIKEPAFNNKTIDRFLVAAESSKLEAILIINKSDLAEDSEQLEWVELYSSIGYKVFTTTIMDKKSLDKISREAAGCISLFWGPSGVGKSSILNTVYPELNLKVGEVSSYSLKGIHTTVTSFMIDIGNGTFIIDTPGVREIDPFGIRKEDLGHYFPEFEDYINKCKFNTCTHYHEPGCAVIEAVNNEQISDLRYDSYLRMLETVENDINF